MTTFYSGVFTVNKSMLAAAQLMPGQAERSVRAGGRSRPSQYKSDLLSQSTPTKPGRTPWVVQLSRALGLCG
jgi:hypothetical protein